MNDKMLAQFYASVFGLSKSDMEKKEYLDDMNKALEAVWQRKEPFDGEALEMAKERTHMISPEDGDVQELATHFVMVDETLSSKNPYEIIFEMYKRMKLAGELSASSDKNILISGGPQTMAQTNTSLDALNQIQKEMETGADMVTTGDNKPSVGASGKATGAAAVKAIEETKMARIKYSKAATVDKIVMAKPVMSKVLVEGDQAQGKVANPDTAMASFIKRTGAVPGADGIQFTNVPVDQVEAAKKMYDILVAAKESPETKVPAHVSKSNPTLKGIHLIENKSAAGAYEKKHQAIETIMEKAASVLKTPVDGLQIMVAKARSTTSTGSKGTGAKKVKDENKFSGIATLRFTMKTGDILDTSIVEYWKSVKKENVVQKGGVKSAAAVKYYKEQTDAKGDKKVGTYRIPLITDQYELVVTGDLVQLGDGSSSGAGFGTLAPINLDDSKAVESMLKSLAEITSVMAQDSAFENDSYVASIRQEADKADEANEAAQAAAIGAEL